MNIIEYYKERMFVKEILESAEKFNVSKSNVLQANVIWKGMTGSGSVYSRKTTCTLTYSHLDSKIIERLAEEANSNNNYDLAYTRPEVSGIVFMKKAKITNVNVDFMTGSVNVNLDINDVGTMRAF